MLRITYLAVGLVAFCFASIQSIDAKDEPKGKEEKTEFTGKLLHPIAAIGGETTGTAIENKNGKYELYLGGNKDLLKQVEALKGKQVTVVGVLKLAKAVETKERRIIVVSEIKEAKDEKAK